MDIQKIKETKAEREESTSSENSLERTGLDDIIVPDQPIHSANQRQQNVTADPESLSRISEQLANLQDRKGNLSDQSLLATQLQNEISEITMSGNLAVSRP